MSIRSKEEAKQLSTRARMRSMLQYIDPTFQFMKITGHKEGSTYTMMDTLKAFGIRQRITGPIRYLGKKNV